MVKTLAAHKEQVSNSGFTCIPAIYSGVEIEKILETISLADTSGQTFRKSTELFAIRQFLKEIGSIYPLIFTDKLKTIIHEVFGSRYFVVKSIYFDKPSTSNWFVAYHQDLTISVDKRIDTHEFGPWTVKQGQFAVQPNLDILKNIFTIRIHLDDTDENNGALKVIPGSHLKGIYRPERIDWNTETETCCSVPAGGLMIMKPLLLHSSGKTLDKRRRRVIHVEFSDIELPGDLQWAERIDVLA